MVARIIEDYEICKVYGWPERRVNKLFQTAEQNIQNSLDLVEEIVIHHTDGGGNWKGLKAWYKNPGSAKQALFQKHIGFTHFYIERGGDIYKAFPITRWMYHSCSGVHDKKTIGIELFHKTGPFTEMQYMSLVILIESLLEECRNIKSIVGHDYNYMKFSNKAKGCPSDDFEWQRLEENLLRKNIFMKFNFEV